MSLSDRIELAFGSVEYELEAIRSKGVRLWLENGQLRYSAPKDAIAQQDIERMRALRDDIVALLARDGRAEMYNGRAEHHVPLAFSQLAHWHLFRLHERPAIRQIASATRLRGKLHVGLLQRSIEEVVRRQSALRTRILVVEGKPVQHIVETCVPELRMRDLSSESSQGREEELTRLTEEFILQPIDVTNDPLFGVILVKMHDLEHVMIVAMQHMISDVASMNIFLREMFGNYVELLKGRPLPLLAMPVQFADYAVELRDSERTWLERHGAYWNDRFAGCGRLRFPSGQGTPEGVVGEWAHVPIHIGQELREELRGWCKLRRTTLPMSIFAAYVVLLQRWCGVTDGVVRYMSDGRTRPELEGTIGFFASVLFLRVTLRQEDIFTDLLNRVTSEYCEAYQHNDFFYMSATASPPAFSRNPSFNWVPQEAAIEFPALNGSDDMLTACTMPLSNVMLKRLGLDQEPGVLLFDTGTEIVGGVHFPLDRHSVETMKRFGRNFMLYINALLRRPDQLVRELALVG